MSINASAFFDGDDVRISIHVYPSFDAVVAILLFVFFYPILIALIHGINTTEIRANNRTVLKARWNFRRTQDLEFDHRDERYRVSLDLHGKKAVLFRGEERIGDSALRRS
ncbi:MAG: hypothetical protein ACYTFG_05840 [Planctomycetota bacterium]